MNKEKPSLCESCINYSCMFQSGIYREKCEFYRCISVEEMKSIVKWLQNIINKLENAASEKGDK